MFLLLKGLVIGMVKDLRQSTVLLNTSRITLAGVITRRELRGTLETLTNQVEKTRGEAQPGATTDL